MNDEEIRAVAEAWHLRHEAARAAGFRSVQLVVNEGRDAGASLPHSHSQLVWLPETPPLVAGSGRIETAARSAVSSSRSARRCAARRPDGT